MRRILVTTVLLVTALGLAGCSVSSRSSRSDSSDSSVSRVPAITAEKGTGTVDTAPQPASDRAVITTGGEPGSAQLALRIPSTKLAEALAQLKKLGRVENATLSTQDVTGVSQDLGARIAPLTTSVDRLVELMSRATTTADLISIETALSDRQAHLESLQAQKRGLDDRVDLATITVNFVTLTSAPVRPGTFLSGLIAGWGSFVAFLSGALVVAGVALPWIAFAAVLTAIAVPVVRRRRTRAIQQP